MEAKAHCHGGAQLTVAIIVVLAVIGGVYCALVEKTYIRNDPSMANYTSVPFPAGNVTAYVAYGQSNGGCFGEPGYVVKHPSMVLQYYNGHVYQMKEPMLGDYGREGCIWARFGDMLVERGVQGHIIIATAAVPGMVIEKLMPNTGPAAYLRQTIVSMNAAANTTTVLFQHGENDAFVTSPLAYGNRLNTLIGWVLSETNTVMRVATSTWCHNQAGIDEWRYGGDPALRAVQLSHAGPNTDSLGSNYRTDNCHFNIRGLDAVARKWADVVLG